MDKTTTRKTIKLMKNLVPVSEIQNFKTLFFFQSLVKKLFILIEIFTLEQKMGS